MAKGFVRELKEMVENKEKYIYINWIGVPEYLYKKNPNLCEELRKHLMDNDYKRRIDVPTAQEEYDYIGKDTCIFENRKCGYAKQDGPAFECLAPSDDKMTCRKNKK